MMENDGDVKQAAHLAEHAGAWINLKRVRGVRLLVGALAKRIQKGSKRIKRNLAKATLDPLELVFLLFCLRFFRLLIS